MPRSLETSFSSTYPPEVAVTQVVESLQRCRLLIRQSLTGVGMLTIFPTNTDVLGAFEIDWKKVHRALRERTSAVARRAKIPDSASAHDRNVLRFASAYFRYLLLTLRPGHHQPHLYSLF